MALFNVSWSFGFAVSPLVAGPLYDYDYRWPFVLLFVVAALTIALLRSLPHEKEYFAPATEEVLVARADHDQASEAYLYAGWCAALVGSVLATVTRNVYPKRIDELVAAGQLRVLFEAEPFELLTRAAATKYSWLAFALALTAAISFLILGRTRRWQHNFQYLVGLQVAGAAAFWVLGNTRSLVIMTSCFIVTGALAGVSFFTGVYYSMVDPAHKHRRAAINEGAVGAGGFAGSMAFGYLAERFDLATPFHYTPVFIALALGVQLLLLRHGRGGRHAHETP
jgi:MFS family permease